MSMVSVMGMLTYRSFMSSVINLCLLLMLSHVRSCARVDKFIIVFWLSRFRCRKILLSFLAALYDGGLYVINHWSNQITFFVKLYLCFKYG